jgi:hypothetical protein
LRVSDWYAGLRTDRLLTCNEQQNRFRPQIFERKSHVPLLVLGVSGCPDEGGCFTVALYTRFGLLESPRPQVMHALIRRLQGYEQEIFESQIVDVGLESVLHFFVSNVD